ncbi:MAG: hypothetical protein LBI48_09450 [Burkholderiaceae bacterium]|jgi:hypothetical protein|nr:hypothetical protein [Burkholderiaceae bacterium]
MNKSEKIVLIIMLAVSLVMIWIMLSKETGPGSQTWYQHHDTERNAQLAICKTNPFELATTEPCVNALRANKIRGKGIADIMDAPMLELERKNE